MRPVLASLPRTIKALLLLAVLRFALAATGVVLSIARGVDAGVAVVTAIVGLAVCAFAVVSTHQGRLQRGATPGLSIWKLALRATYPSTIGLAALTAFSLVLKPQLAALMAGLIAGLGVASLAVAAEAEWLRWNERQS